MGLAAGVGGSVSAGEEDAAVCVAGGLEKKSTKVGPFPCSACISLLRITRLSAMHSCGVDCPRHRINCCKVWGVLRASELLQGGCK